MIKIAQQAGLLFFVENPPPSFFSHNLVDGGLLVLSRFPILEGEYMQYKYGTQSDGLSKKGAIYCKILIGARELHLFTTHVQASYYDISRQRMELTVEVRLDQMKELAHYIDEKLAQNLKSSDDLVLLMGDFNINPAGFKDKEAIQAEGISIPDYNLDIDEYKAMVKILDFSKKYNFHDLMKEKNGKFPVTFAAIKQNDNREIVPNEECLTDKSDLYSQQTLDYIFWYEVNQTVSKTNSTHKLVLDKELTHVEKFLIENHPFTQLSDHFGISTSISLIKK